MLTARHLVLDLITAADDHRMSAGGFARAAEIARISDASVRVALARLVDEGILERPERGTYELNPERLSTYAYIADWPHRMETTQPWGGTWIAADLSEVRKDARSAQRAASRELDLLGFRQWRGGLRLRPDNLIGGLDVLAGRVRTGVLVFGVSELPSTAWPQWGLDDLHRSYRELIEQMLRSRREQPTTDREEFARESLLLGAAAVSAVVRDPLLPTEIDDRTALEALVTCTVEYQRFAVAWWLEFLDDRDCPR